MTKLNAILLIDLFYVLSLFLGYILYRLTRSGEWGRKSVHILAVLISILHLFLFVSPWQSLISGGSMILMLLVIRKTRPGFYLYLIDRKSLGDLFLIAGMALPILLGRDHLLISILSLLVLGIADAAAALVGMRNRKADAKEHKKTLHGSGAFLIVASIIIFGGFLFRDQPLTTGLIIRLVAVILAVTASEAVSHHGIDNITIPLGTWTLLFLIDGPGGLFTLAFLGLNMLTLVTALYYNRRRVAPALQWE